MQKRLLLATVTVSNHINISMATIGKLATISNHVNISMATIGKRAVRSKNVFLLTEGSAGPLCKH